MAVPVLLVAGIYLLSAFGDKFKEWRNTHKEEPAPKPGLTVEIDKSSIE